MKSILTLTLVSAGLMAPLVAGDSVAESIAPVTEDGFSEQNWFGPPYIQFARKNSDTKLPGYSVATTNYTHHFASDFDSLAGDVSSDQFNFWAPFAAINKENFHLAAWLGYGTSKYNTSENNLLTEHTMQSINVPVVFFHDVSEKWIWGGMVMPSYSGTHSSSDNFAISAALAVGYGYSENLELFAGVYYYHGFGEDYVIPGAAFIWRPAPRWEAFLLPPIGGISYNINECWLVSLYGQYSSPIWHVKADSEGPDRDVNMSSLRIGLKAEYNLHGWLWAYVGAGVALGQELDIEDTSDHTLQDSDIDMSPFVQVGLNLRF